MAPRKSDPKNKTAKPAKPAKAASAKAAAPAKAASSAKAARVPERAKTGTPGRAMPAVARGKAASATKAAVPKPASAAKAARAARPADFKGAVASAVAKTPARKPAATRSAPAAARTAAVAPRTAPAPLPAASAVPQGPVYQAEDRDRFEGILLEVRGRLLKEMGHLEDTVLNRSLRESSGELSGYAFHMADIGTDAMEREKAFLFASAEGRALLDINEALRRLYNGEYGTCEVCGDPISTARLEVVPQARMCIRCKQEEERSQGSRGR